MSDRRTYRFPFAKYPAVRIALLLGIGIILSHNVTPPLPVMVGLLCLLGIIFYVIEFGITGDLHPVLYRISLASYLLILLLFGMIWYSIYRNTHYSRSANLLNTFRWEQVEIGGSVYNLKPTSTGKYQIDVAVDTTVLSDSLYWYNNYNMRCELDPEEITLSPELELGKRVDFTVTIYPLEGPRNPHEFDYKGYLASHDIFIQAGVDSIRGIHPSTQLFSWGEARQQVLNLIEVNFDSTSQPLAKALLIGYKNELNHEDKIAFSRAGLSHIIAVSGLHVGFIIAPFWLMIPWFWTFRYGKHIGLFLLVLLLFGYAGLTGFSASVCRASLTGGFLTYGKLFHKVRDSINLTAVSAIILLLINPADIFAPGFQLSFAAVYIILLTIPVIQRVLPNWIRHRWFGIPAMVIIISLLVQIGLFPLLSYLFGEFSLVGPLANALVVPWLGIIVPYSLFLLPISALYPALGSLLNTPNEWFLNTLHTFIQFVSSLEWSWIRVPMISPLFFLIWITGLFFISSLFIYKIRWKVLSLFLLLIVVRSTVALMKSIRPSLLTITVFDVGQGDATLVSTPSGKHFLIDTGRWSPGYNSAQDIILPHLKAEGIVKLDAVFLSHPHADHIGGMTELINTIPIDTIYNSGYNYDSNLYRTYLKRAGQKKIPVKSLSAGQMISLDPSMLLLVYGPVEKDARSEPNEHSLILELIYSQKEFLFMGDAGKGEEKRLLEKYGNLLDTDFLKVGHHGSRTSSSSAFLKIATPEISIVSLAKLNRYHHPDPEAVRRLDAFSRHLYFTSLQRALIFNSDGTNIYMQKW